MVEVSVVVATRDRAVLLSRTLACVLTQRRVDLEVVVVDDGSTDGTAEMLRRWGDPRIRVLSSPAPVGPGAARNAGIRAARADWVALLDDDDLWAPDKLRRQLDAAAATGAQWVYTGSVNVELRDGRLQIVDGAPCCRPDEARRDLPVRNAIRGGPALVLVRHSLLERVGGFDETLPHKEDWDLWIRLAAEAPPAVVAEPLVAYRYHRRQRSVAVAGTVAAAKVIERRYAHLRGGRPLAWPGIYRHLAWLCLRSGRRFGAVHAYLAAARHGDPSSALRALRVLLERDPAARLARPRAVDPEWREAAERWLAALPEPPVPVAAGGTAP